MTADGTDHKATLHRYLGRQREAVLWKLEGLSERHLRWPMTPTGTNLLGLVKHLGCVEYGYFGDTFGRTPPEPVPWDDPDAEDDQDMWATAEESRDDIIGFYRRACAHADQTIESLDLDTVGSVAWWPEERREATLHLILVHVTAETARHAGHADIVRELTDGAAGLGAEYSNLARNGEAEWGQYVAKLRTLAERFPDTS